MIVKIGFSGTTNLTLPQPKCIISFLFIAPALLERYNSYDTNLFALIKQLLWSVFKCPTAFACCLPVLPARGKRFRCQPANENSPGINSYGWLFSYRAANPTGLCNYW